MTEAAIASGSVSDTFSKLNPRARMVWAASWPGSRIRRGLPEARSSQDRSVNSSGAPGPRPAGVAPCGRGAGVRRVLPGELGEVVAGDRPGVDGAGEVEVGRARRAGALSIGMRADQDVGDVVLGIEAGLVLLVVGG